MADLELGMRPSEKLEYPKNARGAVIGFLSFLTNRMKVVHVDLFSSADHYYVLRASELSEHLYFDDEMMARNDLETDRNNTVSHGKFSAI